MSHKDNLLHINMKQKRNSKGEFEPNDILKTYLAETGQTVDELTDHEREAYSRYNEFACPECGEWTSNPLPCC